MNNVVQCEKGTFQSVRKAKSFLNKWYFKTYKANQGHTYTSRTRCVDIQVQTVFIRIYAILPTAALNASISKVRGVVNLASPTTLLYRSPESQRSNGWLCKWYPLEDIDVLVDIDELIFLEILGGTKEGTLLYSDLRLLGGYEAHQQPQQNAG